MICPDGLRYLPYQIDGIRHLVTRPGSLLADDPGLGKTIQVAGALNCSSRQKLSVLVVCPATLKLNWIQELEKWLVRKRSIDIGTSKKIPDSEIVVINYDLIFRKKCFYQLVNRAWDVVVLDEAQYIKNPKTARTKAAMRIQGTYRMALSGTPIVNRPIDAYPILHWILGGNIVGYMQYAKAYCNAHYENRVVKGGGMRRVLNVDGASNLSGLNSLLIGAGMIRRRKADVLKDLPPKTRQIIVLDGGSRDVSRLISRESQIVSTYAEILRDLEVGKPVGISDFAEVRHELALEKVPYAIRFISDALYGEPAVFVVAHHRDVVDALADGLSQYGVVKVVGGMTPSQKDEAVKAFQNGKARVLVGNSAAREGLTLTASSRVIFVELDPVPGNMTQYEDRTHRIGQMNLVLVQHLVFNNSLDVRIARMILRKQGIIDAAIDGGRTC